MAFSKKDIINAKNNSLSLQDIKEPISVVDTHVELNKEVEIVKGQPMVCNVTYLKGKDGKIYCTVSDSVCDSVDDINDLISDEGECVVQAVKRKTKDGTRDFISLQVL